jgi:hypothetical protein
VLPAAAEFQQIRRGLIDMLGERNVLYGNLSGSATASLVSLARLA